MKLNYFYPLVGFVLPTLAIGYGLVIPRSCIAGLNDLTIWFRHHCARRLSHLLVRSANRGARSPPPTLTAERAARAAGQVSMHHNGGETHATP